MGMIEDAIRENRERICELDEIVECGELVICKPDGKPYYQDQVITTYYWVKDRNGKEFKLLVPPYMMVGCDLVGRRKAKEMTQDFFFGMVIPFNELMCKIFGADEFNRRNEELCCTTLTDLRETWKMAMERCPYTGKFNLAKDVYMFGR